MLAKTKWLFMVITLLLGALVKVFTDGQKNDGNEPPNHPAMTADEPTSIEEAILRSGGVYAMIGDADSQLAFVKQLAQKGLTNIDNVNSGGQSVVGKTTITDNLDNPAINKSFLFNGQKNEEANLIVNTKGNFHPMLTLYNSNGKIILVDRDDDKDGKIDIKVTLPSRGIYTAEIISQDNKTGLFTFFAGVNN